MYSFGPIPRQKRSGRIIGTHQKIDRIARKHLSIFLTADLEFPAIKDILHFEGMRGPDGVKIKSPGKDEPRHFIDPTTANESSSLVLDIKNHSSNLATALSQNNNERAAFEAAWLAHAVADGLTPAHHEHFDKHTEAMKDPKVNNEKFRTKFVMTGGGSSTQFVRNNWKYWGAKGLMTSHTLFEAGVASAAKPLSFQSARPTDQDITKLAKKGFVDFYLDYLRAIDELQMYETFKLDGWTRTLATQTTKDLMPRVIRCVTLAWLQAYKQALKSKAEK